MTAALSRAAMRLAARCLGDQRREWALAMQAEFEAAEEDGKALSFALGCLMAASRELPAHGEGRFAIASHVLGLALIVPMAALLLSSLLADFPYSYLAQAGAGGLVHPAGGPAPLVNEANLAAVPSLAVLVLLVTALHLRLAWLVLERDWGRAAVAGTLIAAATMTLIIFTGLVFVDCASALMQAAALVIELMAIAALAHWHARSVRSSSDAIT